MYRQQCNTIHMYNFPTSVMQLIILGDQYGVYNNKHSIIEMMLSIIAATTGSINTLIEHSCNKIFTSMLSIIQYKHINI